MRPFRLDTTISVEFNDEGPARDRVIELLQLIFGRHQAPPKSPLTPYGEMLAAKAKQKTKTQPKTKPKAKAKTKTQNGRFDQFGFRTGTKRSLAAEMFTQGATAAEVQEKLGAPHIELLHYLRQEGRQITKTPEVGPSGRQVFRYTIVT